MKKTRMQFTLQDSLELTQDLFIADKAYYTADEYAMESLTDYKAELEAENAWLRHAESAGWQEVAYLEQHAPWAL